MYANQILPRIFTAMLIGVCKLQDSRQLDFSLFMPELFWIFISEYIFCKTYFSKIKARHSYNNQSTISYFKLYIKQKLYIEYVMCPVHGYHVIFPNSYFLSVNQWLNYLQLNEIRLGPALRHSILWETANSNLLKWRLGPALRYSTACETVIFQTAKLWFFRLRNCDFFQTASWLERLCFPSSLWLYFEDTGWHRNWWTCGHTICLGPLQGHRW